MKAPTIICPECFEHVELPIELVQEVDQDGDLSIHVIVDPQPVWHHAGRHVWDAAGGPR